MNTTEVTTAPITTAVVPTISGGAWRLEGPDGLLSLRETASDLAADIRVRHPTLTLALLPVGGLYATPERRLEWAEAITTE